jgi:integrase
MAGGLHIVKKLQPGKPVRWYVYAWRGGPQIFTKVGGAKPKASDEAIIRAAAKVLETEPARRRFDDVAGLIADYKNSPEWRRLSVTTKPTWSGWLDRIRDEFGEAQLSAFEDRRMRGDILAWRDRWEAQPRSADMAIQVLSRLLSWGVDRTRLVNNVAEGIASLYENNRSDIIWLPNHFEAFNAQASIEVQEAVALAACTGLRRGDLVKLPRTAIGDHAIVWNTGKSRGRALVVIPLLAETKALLKSIEERWEAEQQAQRPSRRKPFPETVLSNSRWQSWTPMGFGSRFNDAKIASGIEVNLHDLRGTFATRCMIAGLTDQEIADILGWTTKEVAAIRVKYVDQARVVVAIGERLARARVN